MPDTHTAANTTLAAVQDAIDAAADGDTVSIPAGSSTWASDASVPAAKKLYIIGAGTASTIIDRDSFGSAVFGLATSGSHISYMQFKNGFLDVDGLDWRAHHCKFDNSGSSWYDGIRVSGNVTPVVHPRGLIDHCTFVDTRVMVYATLYRLLDGDHQHALWYETLTLGGADAVFVEDCAFSGAQMINCCDGQWGARYVFRHNTYTDTSGSYMCEAHSVFDWGRACRQWEIYENTVVSNNPAGMNSFGYIRGGTGVIWNNTCTGYPMEYGVQLNNERDTVSAATFLLCDGSMSCDENTGGEAGWRCRDQIGCGRDDALWTGGSPNPHQAHEPAYIWGNTPNTVDIISPATPNHIVEDRDYFLSAKPGYTPYTYPHPLQGETGTGAKLAMFMH